MATTLPRSTAGSRSSPRPSPQLTHQRDGLSARVEELHHATTAPAEPAELRAPRVPGRPDPRAWPRARPSSCAPRPRRRPTPSGRRAPGGRRGCATRPTATPPASAARPTRRPPGSWRTPARRADEHRDSAERDASVRMQEAEAVYEEQRARAAKAAADFETTLAGRRSAAEDEFTQKMGEAQSRLDEMSELAERTRLEAEAHPCPGRQGGRTPRPRTPARPPPRSSARRRPPPSGSAATPTASSPPRPSVATASTPSWPTSARCSPP